MSIRLRDRVDVMSAEDLTADSHGNPVPDWDNAPSSREPAEVQPLTSLSSTENTAAQDIVISRWHLLLLPITSATPLSRIRWRGETYEVDGEVLPQPDSRGRTHHHEAILKRATG